MDLSLLFFSADAAELGDFKYGLVVEASKFADEHDFRAVWVPERHFHSFGGAYPNPSTLAAALAMVTKRIRIRAGSVVIPLHEPLRVAEEWAVVDNLSRGRVDLAFAVGWNPNDYVLAPDRYAGRYEHTTKAIREVERLWRGESTTRKNGVGENVEVKIFPAPVQKNLEVWLTCSGGIERFVQAGELGLNVLTALLFQTPEELSAKIAAYRKAWADKGHAGKGNVTLMLHTFVGPTEDAVLDKVRAPFMRYLETSVDLWRQKSIQLDKLSPKERAKLLDIAFERYAVISALFGTPEECASRVRAFEKMGVDEVACLMDFGVDEASVLGSLKELDGMRRLLN
jgi:natural product biosynthesis luciferase-like monooxygenase protein